jgi:membrane-bound serine protease (ClpP class)
MWETSLPRRQAGPDVNIKVWRPFPHLGKYWEEEMLKWCFYLYFIGLLMVCLEIFIPGGIVGAIGIISVASSFWIAYTKISTVFGLYFVSIGLIVAMFCIFLSVKLFPRTKFSEKLFLRSNESDFKSTDIKFKSLEGEEGVALTKLRPAGIANIDGRKISVVAEGTFLNKGVKIKVMKVEGNRIVVREISRGNDVGDIS